MHLESLCWCPFGTSLWSSLRFISFSLACYIKHHDPGGTFLFFFLFDFKFFLQPNIYSLCICPFHVMSQYLHPPSNHHHHASSSPLMTSDLSSTPNLSPWSMSSDLSSRTSYSQAPSLHRQDSLSEGDYCPTPVLSPSLQPAKGDLSDETQLPRGYDIGGAHEPIHMPVNLSLYPPPGVPGPPPTISSGFTSSKGFFQPSKRQERIARFRARLHYLQQQHFHQRGMEFAPPQQWTWPPTPRYLWCYRIYDVGKSKEPWRAFIPENQMLLSQFPGHDIHIRDPSIEAGRKVITVAADRGIAYHNDPDLRAPQTFEIKLLDIAQRPVLLEPLPKFKR